MKINKGKVKQFRK